jgi:hypothetical protein
MRLLTIVLGVYRQKLVVLELEVRAIFIVFKDKVEFS